MAFRVIGPEAQQPLVSIDAFQIRIALEQRPVGRGDIGMRFGLPSLFEYPFRAPVFSLRVEETAKLRHDRHPGPVQLIRLLREGERFGRQAVDFGDTAAFEQHGGPPPLCRGGREGLMPDRVRQGPVGGVPPAEFDLEIEQAPHDIARAGMLTVRLLGEAQRFGPVAAFVRLFEQPRIPINAVSGSSAISS